MSSTASLEPQGRDPVDPRKKRRMKKLRQSRAVHVGTSISTVTRTRRGEEDDVTDDDMSQCQRLKLEEGDWVTEDKVIRRAEHAANVRRMCLSQGHERHGSHKFCSPCRAGLKQVLAAGHKHTADCHKYTR